LPQDFFELNAAESRQAILAHELSHMHRLDPGVNLIQLIAQGLFWFHPLVWWANSQLRQEREKCCDERVLAHLGIATRDYCQALIDTLARASRVTAPLGSLAISGPVKHVESRIKTMMNAQRHFAKGPKCLTTTAIVVLALLVVPMTIALIEKPYEENAIGFDRDRVLSAENMKRLGRTLWEFVEGQDEAIQNIHQLKGHCPEDLFVWARESVRGNSDFFRKRILGTTRDPMPVVAYDQTLLKQGKGTNALYLDLHVDFIDAKDLHELSSFMREDLVLIEACYYKIPAENNDVLAATGRSNGALVPNGDLALQYLSNEAIDRIQELLKPRLVSSHFVVACGSEEASMATITKEYFYLGKSKKTGEIAEIQLGYTTRITPKIISETNEVMLNIEIQISERSNLVDIPGGKLPIVTRRTSTNRVTLAAGQGAFFRFSSGQFMQRGSHHFTFKARRLTRLESLLHVSACRKK